jgi:hypothetical protein
VTLTYAREVRATPRLAKRHLRALIERFKRWRPGVAVIWKLEPQADGTPHFHLLVFMPGDAHLCDEITWWASNWYEVVGSGLSKHLAAGTRVEQIREWHGVSSYAAKYCGKEVHAADYSHLPGWERPGRWWGKCSAEFLPIEIRKVVLSPKAATVLRRACLRWYEHQSTTKYRVEDPATGQVRRLRLFDQHARNLMAVTVGAENVRAYHRRWLTSRGGCSLFIPCDVIERLIPWSQQHALSIQSAKLDGGNQYHHNTSNRSRSALVVAGVVAGGVGSSFNLVE